MITFILSLLMPLTIISAPESPFGFEPLEMYEFPVREFPITKYGARQGNVKANTIALQKAMAACNKAGGGSVVVPAGEWLTGPVHFLSNCNLVLSEGAELVFEDNPELYLPAVQVSWEGAECMNWSPLIYAFECENIAITGPGKVRAKMDFWRTWFTRPEEHIQATRRLYAMASTGVDVKYRHMEENDAHMRPHFIHLNRCRNVRLDGFSIVESPFWTTHLFMCKDVYVRGLDSYAHGHNNDGIDIEMTQHILVENCRFNQGDDGIVIKAGRNQDAWRLATPTRDVVVRNCEIVNAHGLLVVGSEISGGVSNVYMHDCRLSSNCFRLFYIKTNHRRGGVLENIMMENCTGAKMQWVFSIETDVLYQWRDIVPTFEVKPTVIRNITARNIRADWAEVVYEVLGDSREPVRGVTLENIGAGEVTKYVSHLENVYDLNVSGIDIRNYSRSGQNLNYSGYSAD